MNLQTLTALRWIPACALLVACADTVAGVDGAVGPDRRDAGGDVADVVDGGGWPLPRDPRAPRLIAPLSTTYTTHRRPTLRWELPSGAVGSHVQVCRDRACSQVETELRVSERSARPAEELAPGIHFWRVFGTDAGGADTTPPSFVWEFFAPHRSTPRDDVRGTFLDVNGDGFGDLVATVVAERGISPLRVGLAVYHGGSGGLREPPSQLITDVIDRAPAAPCPHLVGDVNGDGFGDLIWGCSPEIPATDPRTTSRGAAEVLFGSPGGLVRGSPPFLLIGSEGWLVFGESVSPLGDLNADGYGDIALGMTYFYVGAPAENRPQVLFGGPNGPQSERRIVLTPPPTTTLHWGRYVEGNIGDVNSDGHPDLVVGEERPAGDYPRQNYLYLGAEGGRLASPVTTIAGRDAGVSTPREAENRFGPCDLDGDGAGDVLAVSRDDVTYAVAIHRGRPDVPTSWLPDVLVRPSLRSGPDQFSLMATCAGDLNGDGYSDIFAMGVGRTTGTWVWPGAEDLSAPWLEIDGGEEEAVSVYRYTAGGDVNGDALSDVVVLRDVNGASAPIGLRVMLGSRRFGVRRDTAIGPPPSLQFYGGLAF